MPLVALATYPDRGVVRPSYRDTASILGVAAGVWLGDAVRASSLIDAAAPVALSWSVATVRVGAGLVLLVAGHELSKRAVGLALRALTGVGSMADTRVVIAYKFISYLGIGFNTVVTVPLWLFRPLGVAQY